MSLKLLANVFSTAQGRASMTDADKARALIEFCNLSFTSCNPKVVIHAGLVLFNYLLAFENENKKPYFAQLLKSTRAINDVLAKPDQSDKDVIITLILAQCRLLFKNHELTSWIESNFQ